MSKILYLIKKFITIVVDCVKDISVSVKTKSIKHIHEKDNKGKTRFALGIFILLLIIIIPIGLIGDYIDTRDKEDLAVDIIVSYLNQLQKEHPEYKVNTVKVNKVFTEALKDSEPTYNGINLVCVDMSFPNSEIIKNYQLCMFANKNRNIHEQYAITIDNTTYAMNVWWNTIQMAINDKSDVHDIKYLNKNRIEENINKKFVSTISNDNSNSKDKENNSLQETTTESNEINENSNNDSTIFLTPNKKIISLLTTDELLNKIKSKNKEIIFFVSKDYEDIDNIYDILQQISDNYNITVSYYNIDNISKKEEKEILSLMFSENDFDAFISLEPLLAELNSEYTQYRTLDDTKWTYDFYVSSLINNMFIEM